MHHFFRFGTECAVYRRSEREFMKNGKDRFGETMRLVRQARENIYFAEKDRQLIERLKARLRTVEKSEGNNLGRTETLKHPRRGKGKPVSHSYPVSSPTPRLAPANVRKNATTLKRYLVPVDFSVGSGIALQHAVRIARENNGKLLLFHVLDENIFHPGTPLPENYVEILEKQARDRFKKMARRARLKSREYQSITVWGKDAARTIADHAKKLKASMIIMASHGRTGLKRLVLGSIAERTLRYVECPVLIVKK
jgi:nucleotide-binding universal stress UspA family protein